MRISVGGGGVALKMGTHTFQHVLNEDAALSDLLVDDELLIIRRDQENHSEY